MGVPRCLVIMLVQVIVVTMCKKEEPSSGGRGRFLFSVVSFQNGPCTASDKNGTCYTVSECEARNGVNGGLCAQGYGVCCQFTASSGGTYSENCTYFESPSSPTAGSYSASFCPINSNICQMRLDFHSFQITGPSTSSTVVGTFQDGNLNAAADLGVSTRSQCLTDIFSVMSPGVTNPPIICGINSDQHMYVDLCGGTATCVDLAFQLGEAGMGQRTWNIKVTQYSCDYENLAPKGCTQYFYGESSQVVQTFNFQGNQHLANQHQQICVRNERGMCRICWVQVARGDFDVSSTKETGASMSTGKVVNCCGYGDTGMATEGYDCLVIPGAKKTTGINGQTASQICGNLIVTASGMLTADVFPTSICSTRCPFSIQFASDNYELAPNAGDVDGVMVADPKDEAGRDNVGFQLTYIQDMMGC